MLFILGSVLFTLAAAASLFPAVFEGTATASGVTDVSYFVGALLFTASIYLQILEALNADEPAGSPRETRGAALGTAFSAGSRTGSVF